MGGHRKSRTPKRPGRPSKNKKNTVCSFDNIKYHLNINNKHFLRIQLPDHFVPASGQATRL